MEYIISISKRA